jgi:transposase
MNTELDSVPINGAATETDTSAQASGHTSARMSGPRQRIELITGGERRRRWSWEQKQAIVAESVAPRASPAVIARKYGLNTGQLYTWRRQILRRVPAVVAPTGFARVDVVEESARQAVPTNTTHAARSGLIEVILPGGASVRVDGCIDERALRRVLNALRG